MTDEDLLRVFVYGTLLSGEANHVVLRQGKPLGEAITEARFDLVSLGAFPAMVEGGSTGVRGEVYEVDPLTLEALDRLEGHPDFYRRTRVRLVVGGEVWAYLAPKERARGAAPIEDGDWQAHKKRRE